MDSFSWSDSIRATVSTCLPCFSKNPSNDTDTENEGLARTSHSQTRYDELEGLLADVDDTDGDAETMSLHSNIGDQHRRSRKRSKRRSKKSIRLFGFNLFGRPPIQLPDSDDESQDNHDRTRSHCRTRPRPDRLAIGNLSSAHSSSSASGMGFDSDASPLDTTAIAQLSPQEAARRAAQAAA